MFAVPPQWPACAAGASFAAIYCSSGGLTSGRSVLHRRKVRTQRLNAGHLQASQLRPSGLRRRPDMTEVLDKPATSPISTQKHGDVLIILSNNPPVNALSTPVR